MLDLKKSSSISNFKKAMRKFIRIAILFFTPVVLLYGAVEYLVRKVPTNYQIVGDYMESSASEIEVISLGSSQMKGAINPALIDKKTLNIASSSQHHNTDFQILKQTRERFPALKHVVFEVSYGHFEIPHNTKYFWKGNTFLEYYDVNILDRRAWLKDRLIYSSNPGVYSKLLWQHYVTHSSKTKYNKYGFDENYFSGKFRRLKYDSTAITDSKIEVDRRSDIRVFRHNVAYFQEMLEYCKEEGLEVIICSPPTYSNFNKVRKQEVLKRRDSVLNTIKNSYNNVYFLQTETDTDFRSIHFRNENHLNSDGAKVFSAKLNAILNAIN